MYSFLISKNTLYFDIRALVLILGKVLEKVLKHPRGILSPRSKIVSFNLHVICFLPSHSKILIEQLCLKGLSLTAASNMKILE